MESFDFDSGEEINSDSNVEYKFNNNEHGALCNFEAVYDCRNDKHATGNQQPNVKVLAVP